MKIARWQLATGLPAQAHTAIWRFSQCGVWGAAKDPNFKRPVEANPCWIQTKKYLWVWWHIVAKSTEKLCNVANVWNVFLGGLGSYQFLSFESRGHAIHRHDTLCVLSHQTVHFPNLARQAPRKHSDRADRDQLFASLATRLQPKCQIWIWGKG